MKKLERNYYKNETIDKKTKIYLDPMLNNKIN